MDQYPLLDIEDIPEKEVDRMHTAVKWWERKRLIYNVMLLILQGSLIAFYWQGFQHLGAIDGIIFTFLYDLAANAFYCMGWGLEILLVYYIPQLRFSKWLRWILWIAGLLFSLSLTYFWFSMVLESWSYSDYVH